MAKHEIEAPTREQITDALMQVDAMPEPLRSCVLENVYGFIRALHAAEYTEKWANLLTWGEYCDSHGLPPTLAELIQAKAH